MFGDRGWNPNRCEEQQANYERWLRTLIGREATLVVLELGAGQAVPTVRLQSEQIATAVPGTTLIRVNPREAEIGRSCRGISLEMGALEAISEMLP